MTVLTTLAALAAPAADAAVKQEETNADRAALRRAE
jgi:hypothetical protein